MVARSSSPRLVPRHKPEDRDLKKNPVSFDAGFFCADNGTDSRFMIHESGKHKGSCVMNLGSCFLNLIDIPPPLGDRRGAHDLDDLVDVVADLEDIHVVVGDRFLLGEHVLGDEVREVVPEPGADEDDRHRGYLAGLDERHGAEELVERAESAGHEDVRLRGEGQHGLAREEIGELEAIGGVRVGVALMRELYAEGDSLPARFFGAFVGRLHAPGASAGDDRITELLDDLATDALGQVPLATAWLGTGRSIYSHRLRIFAEKFESGCELVMYLVEMALDPLGMDVLAGQGE